MPRTSTSFLAGLAVLTVCAPAALSGPAAAVSKPEAWERGSWTNVQVIAHRGASAYAPENTLTSFRTAGRMGADLIELDIRQTKDRELVAVHDKTLTRTTDVKRRFPKLKPWRVEDLTLKQIKRLDAGSWFNPKFKGERVPTLTEALRTIKTTGAGALVELKNPEQYPGLTGRLVSRLKADPYWTNSERLTVQSFSWRYVKAVNEALPAVRGAVLGHPAEDRLLGLRWYADAVHPAAKTVTPAYIANAHQRWMEVYVYTVDDQATMRRLINAGVDGITTNRPDVLRALRQF